MTYRSLGENPALHGARVLGFPTSSRIAGRFGLPPATVRDDLLDFEPGGGPASRSSAASQAGP